MIFFSWPKNNFTEFHRKYIMNNGCHQYKNKVPLPVTFGTCGYRSRLSVLTKSKYNHWTILAVQDTAVWLYTHQHALATLDRTKARTLCSTTTGNNRSHVLARKGPAVCNSMLRERKRAASPFQFCSFDCSIAIVFPSWIMGSFLCRVRATVKLFRDPSIHHPSDQLVPWLICTALGLYLFCSIDLIVYLLSPAF